MHNSLLTARSCTEWIIVVNLILLSSISHAQKSGGGVIRGRAVGADGKPSPGTEIYLVSARNETRVIGATQSDSNGNFALAEYHEEIAPNDFLQIQAYAADKRIGAVDYGASDEYVIHLISTARVTMKLAHADVNRSPG